MNIKETIDETVALLQPFTGALKALYVKLEESRKENHELRQELIAANEKLAQAQASLAAARAQAYEEAARMAFKTPFRQHGEDHVEFHSGCIQTRERIVDAIRALITPSDSAALTKLPIGDPEEKACEILTNACQLVDSVKMDWEQEGCWSEWDQMVRTAMGQWLLDYYERKERGSMTSAKLLAEERLKEAEWWHEMTSAHPGHVCTETSRANNIECARVAELKGRKDSV